MNWFEIANAAEIASPSLLFYRERLEANLAEMVRLAGRPERLRPHLKTHKTAELLRRQVELGITRCKSATIAETELAAVAGVRDVLLAYQPVGPHVARLVELARRFPHTRFGCLIDHVDAAVEIARQASTHGQRLDGYLDLDVGQHRTGIAPGAAAYTLAHRVQVLPGLRLAGLHAYDGHLHDPDLAARTAACDAAFAPVVAFRQQLADAGVSAPTLIAGGTPTFAIHAAHRPDAELSPGTSVLWDAGYGQKLPDLAFLPAAVLLTRVVSKPTANRLCLDLGHKAVASEMPAPRVVFLNLPDATPVAHNEEHLVVETPHAARFQLGAVIYALPWHVCPTVALHETVRVVDGGRAIDEWRIAARARRLTV